MAAVQSSVNEDVQQQPEARVLPADQAQVDGCETKSDARDRSPTIAQPDDTERQPHGGAKCGHAEHRPRHEAGYEVEQSEWDENEREKGWVPDWVVEPGNSVQRRFRLDSAHRGWVVDLPTLAGEKHPTSGVEGDVVATLGHALAPAALLLRTE